MAQLQQGAETVGAMGDAAQKAVPGIGAVNDLMKQAGIDPASLANAGP